MKIFHDIYEGHRKNDVNRIPKISFLSLKTNFDYILLISNNIYMCSKKDVNINNGMLSVGVHKI